MGNSGSCVTTLIALTHGEDNDPAFKLLAAQVKEWLLYWARMPADLRVRTLRAWTT